MKVIFFLVIASVILYLATAKYGDYGLNKSISACIIAQKKIKSKMTTDQAKLICETEIKNNK